MTNFEKCEEKLDKVDSNIAKDSAQQKVVENLLEALFAVSTTPDE